MWCYDYNVLSPVCDDLMMSVWVPGVIVQLYYTSVVCSVLPPLQLHSMWVVWCAVAQHHRPACKSLAATLAETTVITVIFSSVTTTNIESVRPGNTLYSLYLLTHYHKLCPVSKIGSLTCKIGQSWSSCCAKSWLCSSGNSVVTADRRSDISSI